MATVKEYFENDFAGDVLIFSHYILEIKNESGQFERIKLDFCVVFNSAINAKFINFYIPITHNPIYLFNLLLERYKEELDVFVKAKIGTSKINEKSNLSENAVFTRRIYYYYEGKINSKEFDYFSKSLEKFDLFVKCRDLKYAEYMNQLKKPLAFVSHDSRDKKEIVQPLIKEFQKNLMPIWYDEYSLNIGDNLRQSIEDGLKECSKCILILSPNFISNNGWTKVEFNSIFTREILEETDLVLPVWCGITKKEVYEYSPSLLNKVGANWNEGLDEVSRKLMLVLRQNNGKYY